VKAPSSHRRAAALAGGWAGDRTAGVAGEGVAGGGDGGESVGRDEAVAVLGEGVGGSWGDGGVGGDGGDRRGSGSRGGDGRRTFGSGDTAALAVAVEVTARARTVDTATGGIPEPLPDIDVAAGRLSSTGSAVRVTGWGPRAHTSGQPANRPPQTTPHSAHEHEVCPATIA